MRLKSILCPIDFSEFSVAAYQYALSLAEYYKARMVALHVVELWKYPFADYAGQEADYAKLSRALNEGGEVRLRRFVRERSSGAVQPELVVHQGNAPNCILSFAQKENMEAIVMGTHGRRGIDRLVLGSTMDRVMRKAACPVLVVCDPADKDRCTGPDGRHCLSRIVYCTDFSHHSERARGYAISLATEYGADLTLLHVAEKVSDVARAEAIIVERTQELDQLLSETERKRLKVKLAVRFGKPYEEIVRFAGESQASLIIMTARGGDAMDRAVFGSTTYRVIQLGPCPVLAIHT
ncbi:MAG TPA: universal stress protein [Candidatus Sulfotelmatobacter sp.]|nr:universal stress protein [Candidatus Sulfotelmatobacter sp.]